MRLAPFAALVKTVTYEMNLPPQGVWKGRISLGIAPEGLGVSLPYLMLLLIFGRELHEVGDPAFDGRGGVRSAEYTVNARVLSYSLEEAMQGLSEIDARLENRGSQCANGPFALETDWNIVSCVGNRDIHFPEIVSGGPSNIQHLGRDYDFKLYRR